MAQRGAWGSNAGFILAAVGGAVGLGNLWGFAYSASQGGGAAFVVLYFGVVVVLTFALVASGLDFVSAFSAVIACVNNMGPGLGVVGPAGNYQALTDFQTWVCSLAMLLGRLEIFTLVIMLTPDFWRR